MLMLMGLIPVEQESTCQLSSATQQQVSKPADSEARLYNERTLTALKHGGPSPDNCGRCTIRCRASKAPVL